MIQCAFTLRSTATRLSRLWRIPWPGASSVAHFSVSTERNREKLGLRPCPTSNISATGPQTPSDQQVRERSRSENRSLTRRIKKAANVRNWKVAQEAFQKASPPDPILYSVLLHAADRCDRAEEAFALYDQMCREEILATGAHFVPLIRLAGRAGQLARACSYKEDLTKLGIAPDAFICAAMVEAYKRAGDVSGALKVWRDMKQRGVDMTPPLLSSLMSAVAQSGDVAGTETLLEEATSFFTPNSIHLNCILDACRHAGDASSARRVFSDQTARGIKPDVVTFTLLVGVMRRAGQANEDIASLLKQMEACGVVADKFFLEEHLSFVLGLDITDFLNLEKSQGFSPEKLQMAAELLQQARAKGMNLSRMACEAEERISNLLELSKASSDWVRVLCNPEAAATPMHTEYFWDRASGRTQWEKPPGPVLQTVQASPTS